MKDRKFVAPEATFGAPWTSYWGKGVAGARPGRTVIVGMELHRDGTTVRLGGQVDGRGTATLRQALADELSVAHGDVVLDLADVDGVDLTALRMIAATSRQAMMQGQRLLLRGCSPQVRRLLHLTHLRGLVAYEEDWPVRVADRTA